LIAEVATLYPIIFFRLKIFSHMRAVEVGRINRRNRQNREK
jgi:hypothetical protein